MKTFVLPLADPNATLETVGGKGMSLAKMAQAGLPVPGGFHVTTDAYRWFIAENRLHSRILDALEGIDLGDLAGLSSVSQRIGEYFASGVISPEIDKEVARAYAVLSGRAAQAGGIPVAVRSSATAEDLPGASFAGQQETYLNICGTEDVLSAIKRCWASLWTARAIAYRARQGIAPESVALAVVVQELVFADASGVLFTANPISGSRDEQMITAAWGLGEAIVGGMVTPDTLMIEKKTGRVTHREISDKALMTIRSASGTSEQPVPQRLRKAQVLNDAQAARLSSLGVEIECLYGVPMDIEWTLAGGNLAVVQARPITSLQEPDRPEAPLEWKPAVAKSLLARGSFGEFVPDPVSPLFATLAVPIAEEETQKMLGYFFKLTDGAATGYLFDVINGYVYVGVIRSPRVLWRMFFLSLVKSKEILKTSKERWATVRARSRELAERWQASPAGPFELAALPAPELLAGVREIFHATAEYYTVAQSGPIPAAMSSEMIFSAFYRLLVRRKTDPEPAVFLLGLDTLPIRAEKSLYDLAMWVKEQPVLVDYLQKKPLAAVRGALNAEPVPAPLAGAFAERLHAHLALFGHTLYDLDFHKPVPADDPLPVLEGMKAYLSGQAANPHERQRAQVERREQAEKAILARLDPLRRKWFVKLLRWAQDCGPDRENCIADMGLGYPQLRALLAELGRRLAANGAINQAGDVYWLNASEADELAEKLESGDALQSCQESILRRKAEWQRAREVTPPFSLPEKSIISKLMVHDNPEGSQIKGAGVSPGKVTARACVLHGPEEFGNMRPGDVIVAVTTTPAWTPLFAMASGVVTDIGGPLSHSSIVAREYGIPAVMATGVATKRIHHGQMVAVDGAKGTVMILNSN